MYSEVRGTGTPIVFLHGFCVDHRILLPLDPVFAADGEWTRIYVDLPGMGQSPPDPSIGSTDDVVDAVAAFVKDAVGTDSFAIVGNSFGGIVARQLAVEFGSQLIGLALLCPGVIADRAKRTVPARVVLERDAALIASLDPADAEEYEAGAVVQTPENWASFRDHVLPGLRSFDPAAARRILADYELSALPEKHSEPFHGPALFLLGRQDAVVGYVDALGIVGHYPHSTVAILDRAGHNAHLDQPELTAALLRDWRDRVKALCRGNVE